MMLAVRATIPICWLTFLAALTPLLTSFEVIAGPYPASDSNKTICHAATQDRGGRWDERSYFALERREANRRGLTLAICRQLLSGYPSDPTDR